MPDWMTSIAEPADLDSTLSMAIRLAAAFACGCVIAGIYRFVRPKPLGMPTFPATLVLLAILCAMLPMVIGQNVAWAFGLVGALSIVRFRTVVEDTYDITFVIFAVLVGMAAGADRLSVAVLGIVFTGLAAAVVRPRSKTGGWTSKDAKLQIRLGVGRDADAVLRGVFDQRLSRADLVSGSTSRQGASLDLIYRVRLLEDGDATQLIHELNRLDGVQSVELRRGRS